MRRGRRAGVRSELGPPPFPSIFSKIYSAIAHHPSVDTSPAKLATKCRENWGEGLE